MDRVELGERLQQWHSSSHDPVYAVGSYYFAGHVYPKKEVVEDCLRNLTDDIEKFRKMLRGEKVSQYNSLMGNMVDDLRKFAGYTDSEMKEYIVDLTEIVSEVQRFMEEDYK